MNALWLSMLQVICERAKADESYASVMGGVLAGMIPASRVLDPAVLAKTVTQALVAASIGLTSHDEGGTGRTGSDDRPSLHGVAAQAGVRMVDGMAREFVRRPADTLRWGLGLAGEVADLAALMIQQWRWARARDRGATRRTTIHRLRRPAARRLVRRVRRGMPDAQRYYMDRSIM